MKQRKLLPAFLKKELLEAVRTGKLLIITLLFLLFGIMNPAIAKLTPWMMELFADSMADSGLVLTDISVDAMTSWTQFFKNLPIALIAFVLIFGDSFTKEYNSGTLLLLLTKGLSRYRVVIAKTTLLLLLWTLGYGLCFGVTYGYNAYFWDNHVARNLFHAAAAWWLFGVWVICLVVLFSVLLQEHGGVCLCTGGTALLACLLCIPPNTKTYSPALLMEAGSLLSGAAETNAYGKAIVITAVISAVCIGAGIPVMNRKRF